MVRLHCQRKYKGIIMRIKIVDREIFCEGREGGLE